MTGTLPGDSHAQPVGPTPLVSVVVPVHDAMPYLRELLESLDRQDFPQTLFDVIAVDDGSTDEGGAVLDQYAASHRNTRVFHQENSGAPGRPRNTGLRASRAKYVFFADADDMLGPECLRRLVSFAEEHGSDIVIPRMVPVGGRRAPSIATEPTVVAAGLQAAFRTLFPQKLYRRQLLVDQEIAFPEARTHLEDGIFNAHAYMRARRISILDDYDHYLLRARGDGRNFSRERLDPARYVWAVSEIARIVRTGAPSREIGDEIVLDLYARKCLEMYSPGRFLKHDEAVQQAWMAAHRAFAQQFSSEEMEARLDSPLRERAWFVRQGDRAGLIAHLDSEAVPRVTATLSGVHWSRGGLDVTIDAAIHGRRALPPQLVCELRRRDGQGSSGFPMVRAGEAPPVGVPGTYHGVLPVSAIDALVPEAYDLYLTAVSGQERYSGRVGWSAGVSVPDERHGLRVRGARGGSVSIRKNAGRSFRITVGLRQAASRIARGLGRRRPAT